MYVKGQQHSCFFHLIFINVNRAVLTCKLLCFFQLYVKGFNRSQHIFILLKFFKWNSFFISKVLVLLFYQERTICPSDLVALVNRTDVQTDEIRGYMVTAVSQTKHFACLYTNKLCWILKLDRAEVIIWAQMNASTARCLGIFAGFVCLK